MRRWPLSGSLRILLTMAMVPPLVAGCLSPKERTRILRENLELRQANERLQRKLARQSSRIATLNAQVTELKGFGEDRPADMFAPVKLEIASLSGGADYDGKPGDDGVTVHLRVRDVQGDSVKVPGKMTIQLVDNARMGDPKVLGLYVFADKDVLNRSWHGRFRTSHYTFRCPFNPEGGLPGTSRVDVRAEFVDYLTGRVLTAVKEVSVTPPAEDKAGKSP